MNNYINQYNNIFTGMFIEKKENQLVNHCIVTDHPFMHDLGLSAFTTGELFTWLTTVDNQNNYVNMAYVGNYQKASTLPDRNGVEQPVFYTADIKSSAKKILGSPSSYAYTNPTFEFEAWRNVGYGGKYQKYTGDNWQYYNTYRYFDLNIEKYENKKVNYSNGPFLEDETTIDEEVSRIIVMNDYVTLLAGTSGPYSHSDKAAIEYIKDIKTSKYKCVEWSGVVPFHLGLDGIKVSDVNKDCIKEEMVRYKLYLFDEQMPRDDARKLALNDFVIVRNKVDAFGRVGNYEDGILTSPSLSINPTDAVAADLDVTFNEFTQKWESGTQQKIAIILDDIPAAKVPSLDDCLNFSVKELIETENQSESKGYVTTGEALPLVMHNGNPLQHGPITNMPSAYASLTDDASINKYKIKIFNRLPRAWLKGEVVVISKIDGVWQPIAISDAEAVQPVGSVENNWDFMYLATNSSFYFRSNYDTFLTPKIITYANYEKSIREHYYHGDLNNSSLNNSDLENAYVENAFYQFTSWDFMGPNIGGKNIGNTLACTQTFIRPDGQNVLNNGEGIKGTHTAPFFGCVFPDGYDSSNNYTRHKNLPTGVVSTNDDFFQNISQGSNLYTNNNLNQGESNAGGMFVDDADTTLKQLPADIALNAAPNSENGRPLLSVRVFDHLKPLSYPNGQAFRDQVKDLFHQPDYNNWLYFDGDQSDSLFAFTPLKNNTIQFRPLKMEVYASFDDQDNTDRWNYFAKSIADITINKVPGQFALERNKKNNNQNNLLIDDNYLKYNKDILDDNPLYDGTLTSHDSFGWPQPIFEEDWMANPSRPAGGVGIIGASVSVIANETIEFITDNFIGLRGWWRNQFWYPSVGTSHNYYDLQTTQLFVRVFHSWPKEQTIYDPRFFSVFHFNPGVNLTDYNAVVNKYYFNNSEITEDEYNQNCQSGQCQDYNTGYYTSDSEITSVDLRIPTSYDNTLIPVNTLIYKDTQVRDRNYSKIDTQRRGKLLPYTYQYPTIAINEDLRCVFSQDINNFDNVQNVDILIFDKGSGYSNEDTFTIVNSNGVQAILYPVLDGNGSIVRLTLNNPNDPLGSIETGNNYSKDIFQEENADISQITFNAVSAIQELDKKSNGTNFRAMILKGKVVNYKGVDSKPQDLGILKLTPDLESGSSRPATIGSETFKETNETFVNSLILQDGDKDINSRYDLFFHFHNDISHTLSQDYVTIASLENQVTLTINVT